MLQSYFILTLLHLFSIISIASSSPINERHTSPYLTEHERKPYQALAESLIRQYREQNPMEWHPISTKSTVISSNTTSFSTRVANNDVSIPFTGVYCETSNASPLFDDAFAIIKQLQNSGQTDCRQRNVSGSKCTTIREYKDAAVGICGSVKLYSCKELMLAWLQVMAYCVRRANTGEHPSRVRVGGKMELYVSQRQYAIVF